VLRDLGRDPEELARQEAEIRERLARATELYMSGLWSKDRLDDERQTCEIRIADLTPRKMSDIMSAESHLRALQTEWQDTSDLEKKKLLRRLIAAAFVRGHALVGL
jgi:hypothetical protein